jgi:hypothetical protein
VELDTGRLAVLAPEFDAPPVERRLSAVARIAARDSEAGPIARLEQSERFGLIVAPSSTVTQPSAVHVRLSEDPAATLDHLFRTLVQFPLTSLGS